MNNGNLAEAQLRALIDVAAVAAGAHRLEEVLELAAERSLDALECASLSISRWDADTQTLRTLVNVGELGPGEERFPEDETYSVEDYPSLEEAHGRLRELLGRGGRSQTPIPPSGSCSRASGRKRACPCRWCSRASPGASST